jgi:hypothetical protein
MDDVQALTKAIISEASLKCGKALQLDSFQSYGNDHSKPGEMRVIVGEMRETMTMTGEGFMQKVCALAAQFTVEVKIPMLQSDNYDEVASKTRPGHKDRKYWQAYPDKDAGVAVLVAAIAAKQREYDALLAEQTKESPASETEQEPAKRKPGRPPKAPTAATTSELSPVNQ